MRLITRHAVALFIAFAGLLVIASSGQEQVTRGMLEDSAFPRLSGLDDLLSGLPAADAASSGVATSARVMSYQAGKTGVLQVAADMNPGWHLYSITQPYDADGRGPRRTEIVIQASGDFVITGPFQPDHPPTVVPADLFPVPEEYHEHRVVWSAPIRFSQGVSPEQVMVTGHLRGQLCQEDGACVTLKAEMTSFQGGFAGVVSDGSVGADSDGPPTEVTTAAASSSGQLSSSVAVSAPPSDSGPIAVQPRNMGGWLQRAFAGGSLESAPIGVIMAAAFLGGLILNLMPCVLPVIGLKLMSFSQQAGESRGRILALNLSFLAGLMGVFMVLAALAAFAGLAWGAQFQKPEFGIAMAVLVFVFALSFLGVWEVPIPGFVGRGKTAELSEREGLAGAFFKGVLTTLLATPCSGPLIMPVLGWASVQATPITFATFACMGLGMGSPYLLIGLMPGLANRLPRPGAWMETFKELMGFVLLATVVWIFSFIKTEYFLPTLALMFASWAACWWIGRVPITAEWGRKVRTYVMAIGLAVLLGMGSFRYLSSPATAATAASDYPAFSQTTLDEYRQSGKTVLVDFTADWCTTCKLNEKLAIYTETTEQFLADNEIEVLVADLTEVNPEAERLLERLGNKIHAIPFYAVFPGDDRPAYTFGNTILTQNAFIGHLETATASGPFGNGTAVPATRR